MRRARGNWRQTRHRFFSALTGPCSRSSTIHMRREAPTAWLFREQHFRGRSTSIRPALPELGGANSFTGYNNFSAGRSGFQRAPLRRFPSAVLEPRQRIYCHRRCFFERLLASGGGSVAVNICRSNGTAWVYLGPAFSPPTDGGGPGYGSWPPFGIGIKRFGLHVRRGRNHVLHRNFGRAADHGEFCDHAGYRPGRNSLLGVCAL